MYQVLNYIYNHNAMFAEFTLKPKGRPQSPQKSNIASLVEFWLKQQT